MTRLIPCPKCHDDIYDDSAYCDQCGEELYICPKCRIFGKGAGKRCGKCGSPLVRAGQNQALQNQQDVSQNRQPQQIQHQTPTGNPYNAAPKPTRLVCRKEGVILPLINGAQIGRTTGNYVTELAGLGSISGQHARLSCDGSNWTITDIGSRNGTEVNGMKCMPHRPIPIRIGDMVRLAQSYDFTVE